MSAPEVTRTTGCVPCGAAQSATIHAQLAQEAPVPGSPDDLVTDENGRVCVTVLPNVQFFWNGETHHAGRTGLMLPRDIAWEMIRMRSVKPCRNG